MRGGVARAVCSCPACADTRALSISVAWCKQHEVPIEKIYTKVLLEKFGVRAPSAPALRGCTSDSLSESRSGPWRRTRASIFKQCSVGYTRIRQPRCPARAFCLSWSQHSVSPSYAAARRGAIAGRRPGRHLLAWPPPCARPLAARQPRCLSAHRAAVRRACNRFRRAPASATQA